MERTGERQQEHYCWVKIVAPPDDGDAAADSSRSLPPSLRRAFDSARFLKKMADGDSPPGNDRPPPGTAPPPPGPSVPPPPPHVQRIAGGAQPSPAWQVERSRKPEGDFGMEVAGMGIDREAAQRWIESEEGRRWRAGAVGVDLVLFKGPRND